MDREYNGKTSWVAFATDIYDVVGNVNGAQIICSHSFSLHFFLSVGVAL